MLVSNSIKPDIPSIFFSLIVPIMSQIFDLILLQIEQDASLAAEDTEEGITKVKGAVVM